MHRNLIALALLAGSLYGQQVKPQSITITAVPGYPSSPQRLSMFNTGTETMTVQVGITGPFSISQNKCLKGLKPQTHCDVYVVYSPQQVGTDSGELDFTYEDQTQGIQLVGNAVSSIPTMTKAQYSTATREIHATLAAAGDIVPDGELMWANCMSSDGVNSFASWAELVNNKAMIPFQDGDQGVWYCEVYYQGDSEFGPSTWHIKTR